MNPDLLPPPEFATATPPAWAVAGALLFAVLLTATFTVSFLSGLAP
jgi:hypothetical protein